MVADPRLSSSVADIAALGMREDWAPSWDPPIWEREDETPI